ncbi:serine hydrolase domain-containing protein [Longimicrobium sp.]|uniref:serine hydrolase domain-containing protein n=1 Tax=Longimicrobium sp. TaxID=2029185 RepID=UPI002C79DB88|nr:serine hydrolase domain-containing protein [Longimicrobium sp.]HSU16336.1 serine hydrolase domain-containing protein [Longimicrobium sp.]
MNRISLALVLAAAAGCMPARVAAPVPAAQDRLAARLQAKLDSLHSAGHFPGATVGIQLPGGRTIALAAGVADSSGTPMRPRDRMLAGSVGKTFVAAVALQLVGEGKLGLDQPISTWLGTEPWFGRLPNARQITVRMLMNHTSGLVRYEFNDTFLRDLNANPGRRWTPAERIAYILGTQAPFEAGRGWDYSDTNYIVLGAIVERITGSTLEREIRRRVLDPHRLADVLPSDSVVLPGVVQGYAGADNPFGHEPRMIRDGRFIVNPQFEWAGGGYATSAADLARWAALLWGGRAFGRPLLAQVVDGVAAPALGNGVRYGLGVIVREGPLGPSWGHSGYFPGYLTDVRYYPRQGFAVALQVNTSARGAFTRPPGAMVEDLARIVSRELAAGGGAGNGEGGRR